MTATATLKKSIKPVTFTIKVTAKKVNENGTFSGLEIQGISGSVKNSTFRVVAPPQAGGAMYIKCDTLDGLELVADGAVAMVTKTKLF